MRLSWLFLIVLSKFFLIDSTRSSEVAPSHPELETAQLETERLLAEEEQKVEQLEQQLHASVDALQEEHAQLLNLEQSLIERTWTLQASVMNDLNAMRLQHLAKQLNETVHAELKSRDATLEVQSDDENKEPIIAIPVQDVVRHMEETADNILADSRGALHNWVVDVIADLVNLSYETAATAAASIVRTTVSQMKTRSSASCIRPSDGAQLVQEAIVSYRESLRRQQFTGMSATVVHEFTTATYAPPPDDSALLGHVSWRRHIPEDVERILPDGWQQWNVGLSPATKRLLNLRDYDTLPPEAILDANTLPGACWPMAGKKGHVTLRLTKPMSSFTSITIHHSDALLQETSMPRHFVVSSYPPCSSTACGGLGFNVTAPTFLTKFEFDGALGAVQTFTATPPEGSCQVIKPTCDADNDSVIAAIKIEITSNWGNEDFTCLYRVKLN